MCGYECHNLPKDPQRLARAPVTDVAQPLSVPPNALS